MCCFITDERLFIRCLQGTVSLKLEDSEFWDISAVGLWACLSVFEWLSWAVLFSSPDHTCPARLCSTGCSWVTPAPPGRCLPSSPS